MKVVILYHPNSEHGRVVETFARDYGQRYHSDLLELLSVDTRDGSSTASLYDVMQYPAIMVLRNDGYLNKLWEGSDTLPLIDDVASYARG